MRVVLTSIGTVGDVQPLIALSSALRQRRHKPVFALPVELLEYPRRYHFETHQIGPDLREATLQSLRDLSQGQKNIDTYHQVLLTAAPMESGGVSAVIPLRALNVEVLSKAIRQVITDIAYKRAAEELGRRIRDEQGTETACLLIENFVAHIKQNNENMSGA